MENMIMNFKDIEEVLKMITRELQALPDGRLVKKGTSYYHAIGNKEIGITRNLGLVSDLSRKKHILNYKKQLDISLSKLSNPIRKLNVVTQKEMIRMLPRTYHGLPDSYFLHSTSIKKWLAEPFERHPFLIDKKDGITTEKGLILRSKSEYILANLFDSYDLPYRYEAAIHFDEQTTEYPDFTFLEPAMESLILWEHFGALHLPGYIQKMNNKVKIYMKHGFIPFKNLICTFESDIMDTRHLKNLIENIILRRSRWF